MPRVGTPLYVPNTTAMAVSTTSTGPTDIKTVTVPIMSSGVFISVETTAARMTFEGTAPGNGTGPGLVFPTGAVPAFMPVDMTREDADRIVEALEAPWGLRVEKALRSVFTPETAEGEKTTRRIGEQVKLLGLQPWKAPEPLPPIDEDEVVLVVWMVVDSAERVSK